MGKSSHKSKHREPESEEPEEFVVPEWVSQLVARLLKVYAKELVTRFLRMKINTIDAEIHKQLTHAMSLSDKAREEHFAALLEDSKPARAKKPKAVKKPNEPKKNQTAYFIWSASFKKEDLEREYPEYAEKIKNKELITSKVRGMIWKALPEAEKDKFSKLAEKDKERWIEEMKNFDPEFVVPAASRAPSRAPSRASSPEPASKSKKKKTPAPRDESPKRKPAAKKKSEEPAPAKKAKKQTEEPEPAKKKSAASKRKISSSSSEDADSFAQSEGPSEWAD